MKASCESSDLTPENDRIFPSKDAEEAWNLGLKHKKQLNGDERGYSFYYNLTKWELEYVGQIEERRPIERAFYESAVTGAKMPRHTTGYRKGGIPRGGVSKNHVDQIDEMGVSMARVSGVNYEWASMGGRVGQKMTAYTGWLLDYEFFWGSDGEPLMVGLVEN